MDSNNSESGSSSHPNDPKLPEPPSAAETINQQNGVEVVVAEEEATNMEVNQPNRAPSPQNTAPISSPHEPERTFACKHCNKRFSSCMALGGHQNAHRKERAMEKMMSRDHKKLFRPHKEPNFFPMRMDPFAAGGSVTNVPWTFLSQLTANPSYIPLDVLRQLTAALPNPYSNNVLPSFHQVDDQQHQLVLPNRGQTLDQQQHGDRLLIRPPPPPNQQPHTLDQFVVNWRGQQQHHHIPGLNQGGSNVTSIYDRLRFRGEMPQNNQAADLPQGDSPLPPQRPITWEYVGSSSRSGVPQQQQQSYNRLPFYEFLPPAANVRTRVEEPNTPPRPEIGDQTQRQVDDPGERNGGEAAVDDANNSQEAETNVHGNGGNPQQEGDEEEGGGNENRDGVDLNLKLA